MNFQKKITQSETIIRKSLKTYQKIFIACSFGKDSRVVLDLVLKYKPDIKVYGIDTGYEFIETIKFAEMLTNKLQLNFTWTKPLKKEKEAIDKRFGKSMIVDGEYKCCAMKIPAIGKLLTTHNSWITGLRRDETLSRSDIQLVEKKNGIYKINPIAFWTNKEIWKYITDNNLDYHPLYNKGYSSLGCKPCTKSNCIQKGGGTQGTFERAGRFTQVSNIQKECGIHLNY